MPSTRPARPAIGVVVVVIVVEIVVIVVEIVVVGEDLQNCGLLSKDRHRDNWTSAEDAVLSVAASSASASGVDVVVVIVVVIVVGYWSHPPPNDQTTNPIAFIASPDRIAGVAGVSVWTGAHIPNAAIASRKRDAYRTEEETNAPRYLGRAAVTWLLAARCQCKARRPAIA
jgi:hypothetical protein